jgi:hypothetical protein
MQRKPLPHPTGPLTQPIGPFQPPPPQLPPPPQFPRSPPQPPPPEHPPQSPQSPRPWPWPPSSDHGVPDATGDGGLAFATPAPNPKAVKPTAPAIVASAKIFISFIVQPLYDSAYCNPASRNFRPLHRPPQGAAQVLVVGSKGLVCPVRRPVMPLPGVAGRPSRAPKAAESVEQRLDQFPKIFGECCSAV